MYPFSSLGISQRSHYSYSESETTPLTPNPRCNLLLGFLFSEAKEILRGVVIVYQ